MPDLAALKPSARAAIVMPSAFAIADQVIDKPQTAIFAAFGSFAVLVLVEFGGRPRTRLLAYLGLAGAGACLIPLGTLCSRDAWLAGLSAAAVGFAVLFAGAFSDYLAAGASAAIVAYVLPVTIPAPASAIPDRLEGWMLANGLGICAVMLLWPPRRREDMRRQTAGALRALADLADSDREGRSAREEAARGAVSALARRSLGAQHRPSGPVGTTAALAALPDELGWILTFLLPAPDVRALDLARGEGEEALASTAAVLRASAERLERHDAPLEIERLDAARDALASALVRRLDELPPSTPDGEIVEAMEPPFRIRVASYAARQIAGYALRAAGADASELERQGLGPPVLVQPAIRAGQIAVEHARLDSIWFRNSARGALGLALAVFIADRAGLQHGFWVVLGMLAVLRSNALGTGWSILSALAGTAAGIVVGALLVVAIGTHDSVLWGVLPLAVLLASYAPRAISFAAGQAGFTIVLFVLFNIVQPVGWRVGVVRVEDVAIGFAISLGVGVLFWPRGAAALLRGDLANAYTHAVDSVVAAARAMIDPDEADAAVRAAHAADTALHRLDDSLRQYLTERSATPANVEDVAALVAGSTRVNRAAQSLTWLAGLGSLDGRLARCGRNLNRELDALQSWYITLGYDLVNQRPVPAPHIRDDEGRRNLVACVRTASHGDDATARSAFVLLMAEQHLDSLWRLEARLGERANAARAAARGGGRLRRLGFAS